MIIRSGISLELNCADCKDLPEWVPISPIGPRIVGLDGRCYNLSNAAALVADLNKDSRKIALDIAHSSEIKAPKGDDFQVVNWFNEYRVNEETEQIDARGEWIEPHAERVRTGELRYVSPGYSVDRNGNILGIRSAGFVPRPNFPDLQLNSENLMNEEELKAVRIALNLDQSASGGDIVAAVQTLKSEHQTSLNAEKTPDITRWVPRNKFDEVESERAKATAELNSMKSEAIDVQINAAIDKGKTDGKIPPALVDVYKSQFKGSDGLTQLNAILEKAPVIAGSESSNRDNPPAGATKTELNAEQAEIADMFGNTAEDLAAV